MANNLIFLCFSYAYVLLDIGLFFKHTTKEQLTIKQFVKRKIRTLLLPYIAFGIINYAVWISINGFSILSHSRPYRNIMVTVFLSGIWHGSGMSYMIWELIHAFAQCENGRCLYNSETYFYSSARGALYILVDASVFYTGYWCTKTCRNLLDKRNE